MKLSSILRPLSSARRGQVLAESLVALGILTTSFLGVFTLLSRSIGLNRVVSDNYTATYLAAEGLEVVKNILDANVLQRMAWNDGITGGDHEVAYDSTALMSNLGRTLFFDPVSVLYQYDTGRATAFRRTVTIGYPANNDEITVKSVVSWTTRGGGSYTVNLEDHFMNWRPRKSLE